jgi:hypothetical protein
MRRKSVEAEIIGGLGNQLFGLAAGLYLARKTSTNLTLNLSQVGLGGTDHGKSIKEFNIPESYFSESETITSIPNFMIRISNKIAREVPAYKTIRDSINEIYTAEELGFESDFATLTHPRYIKGYFQTHVYADCVKSELRDHLTLKSESDWYLNKIREIEKNNPIAIHMRRGDYLKLRDEFGVLDIEYYVGITQSLMEMTDSPIWIFTDSPEIVRKEIEGTVLQNAMIIEPPVESSPNESMLLISKCHTIVMSNSTFSWWASYLSSPETVIYAPSKWFKGRNDPARLIPPNWSTAISIWQSSVNEGGGLN